MPSANQQYDDNASSRRIAVTPEQSARMMHMLLRHKQAFDLVRGQLLPEHLISAEDPVHSVIWECALAFAEAWDGALIPDKSWMLAELSLLRDSNGVFVAHNVDTDELDDALSKLYDTPAPPIALLSVAISDCRMHIEEHIQKEVQFECTGEFRSDLPELLRSTADKLIGAQGIGSTDDEFRIGSEDWENEPIEIPRPTGIDFFDDMLEGGDVAGEISGFIGPYGSCKTTISCMLAVQAARQASARQFIETGSYEGAPISIIVSWEDPRKSIFDRCLAYAAEIEFKSIFNKKLSTADDRKPYELRRQREMDSNGSNGVYPCELERARAWFKMLNMNLRLIDFSGSTENMRMYAGDMHKGLEIAIKRLLQKEGNPPIERIVIDHASAAAKRFCERNNKDMNNVLRHLISAFPRNLTAQIGQPLNCPIWLMHQANTEVLKHGAGHKPSMADASECKSFFEAINSGFVINLPTLENLCVLGYVKHRRTSGKPNRVLQIRGDFACVQDADRLWTIENNQIISRNEQRRVVTGPMSEVAIAGSTALFDDSDGIGV